MMAQLLAARPKIAYRVRRGKMEGQKGCGDGIQERWHDV